jgi:formate dehydrogenase gamma subunit
MEKVYIYKIFERFWHWSQALIIFFLMLTGFEIHGSFGSYELFGFENSVVWHQIAAWAFLTLIVFAIFWHITSGEWKQYIPTTKLIKEQFMYYIGGIFKNAPHPTNKTVYNKFNPLQRMIYLGLKILVIPVMVISGFIYLYFQYPKFGIELESLDTVALIHTLGAYILIAFVIAHVYLTTITGVKPLSSIKAMITGWEEMEKEEIKVVVEEEMEVALKSIKKKLHAGDDRSKILDQALEEVEGKLGVKRETYFRDAISESGAGYFCIGKDGIYKEVNKAWLNLYKYDSKNEIIGQHYRLSRSSEDFVELEKTVAKVLQGETINHGEVKRICKDGSVGYHTLTLSPVYLDDKIECFEGFVIDTTDKHFAETEMEKKKERLAHRKPIDPENNSNK